MRKRKSQETSDTTGNRITPMDIQQKEFRLAFRGYNERDVDQFLDALTESLSAALEENQRLREQSGGLTGIAGPGDPAREADEIVRRANEEADRIVREARGRAGTSSATDPVDVRGIPSFLTRERDFLQGMAAMIQGHAETVREMARDARSRAQQPAPPAETEPAEAPAPVPAGPEPGSASTEETTTPASITAEVAAEPIAVEPIGARPAGGETAEPETPAPATAAEGREQVEALEPETVPEEAVELPEAEEEPAPVPVEPAEARAERPVREAGQRSLRELFWGED